MHVNKQIFNNIKIHTQYSICEGAIKIDDLADYCKSKKVKTLGLADSFNLCGALEFSEKLSKVGTQPIIGTQINLKINNTIGRVTLYAKSQEGFKNLTKLSSSSYLKSSDNLIPTCGLKDLISNNKDLIILTGNYRDFFGKLFSENKLKDFDETINTLKSYFDDRIYFEVQRHKEFEEKNFENYILDISKKVNIPLIATQEIFYIYKEMYEAHDALVCIEKNYIDDKNRFRFSDSDIKNDELIELYSDIPEALENNFNFHKIYFKPSKSKPILPSIANGKSNSPEDELLDQANEFGK